MKYVLEELSFLLEDIAGLVWWVVRAFVVVLVISVGIVGAVAAVGWLLRVSLSIM